MNTTPHIIQKIAKWQLKPWRLLIISALLLSSCLKEDMSNCPEQIRVYFDVVTLTEGGDAINPDDVDRMHLYVFNRDGYYLGEYVDNHIPAFSESYYIDCSDLLPGKYKFIAWGGKYNEFYSVFPVPFVKGKTSFDEALLTLEHSNEQITNRISHLFHSELPATVTNEKVQRFDMPLMQITNTINIRTEGLPADVNAYRFDIADDNCNYLFDRSFADCSLKSDAETFTYTAKCTKDGASQLQSTLNVMRLAADRHTPHLQVVNETSGTLLYPVGAQSGNLIELIQRANPANDFDKIHTYDIVFRFSSDPDGNSSNFTVTIWINNWKVREQDGELVE